MKGELSDVKFILWEAQKMIINRGKTMGKKAVFIEIWVIGIILYNIKIIERISQKMKNLINGHNQFCYKYFY